MIRYILFLCLTILCLPYQTYALTHLAVNATDVEKAQWQTRAVSGPYKSDWDIIKGRADTFRSSPSDRWDGNTSGVCYGKPGAPAAPSREQDMGLRDAAFVYFVTGDTSYVANVRQELLEQTTKTGTDFSNESKWCVGPTTATTTGFGNGVGVWLRKLAYAYSYIKPALSVADQNTLNIWFGKAGTHIQKVLNEIVKKRFPNRLSNNYTPASSDPGTLRGKTHFGGPNVYSFMEAWSNEGAGTVAALSVIAVLVNDNTLKDHASRFVQEYIKYGTFPGGQIMDQARWQFGATTGTPQHAYLYSGAGLGSILTAVDALARSGHINLFDYSTTVGLHGTQGGPKTVLKLMQHFAGLTNGTILEYAHASSTANPEDIIDSVSTLHGQRRIEYVNLAHGNLSYNDPAVKLAYEKTFTSGYNTVGCDMLGSDWCHLPGVRFMYGGLEGISMPYGGVIIDPNPDPDYATGLVMYLPMNEGSSATVTEDATGNDHDGTLSSGASWTTGKGGDPAILVDGTTTGTVIAPGLLGSPSSVTLTAWVKPSAFPTATADVLSIGDAVMIRLGSTFIRGDYGTSPPSTGISTGPYTVTLSTTNWNHLAYTVTPGAQRLYLNGTLVASSAFTTPINYSGRGTNTYMGGHANGYTTNFRYNGAINNARVYNRVLSEADIDALIASEDIPPLIVTITSPTSDPTYISHIPVTTVSGTVAGGTPTNITWTCETCTVTEGTGVFSPPSTWAIPGLDMPIGTHILTVTAESATATTLSDTITITRTEGLPDVVTGLILRLAFNEGSGPTAVDSTGITGNAALSGGYSWTSGLVFPSAVQFDGLTGRGTVPGNLGQPSLLTIATHFQLTGDKDNNELISVGNKVVIRAHRNSVSGFYWNGTDWIQLTYAVSLGAGWHHIAFVMSGSERKLYLDGILVAQGVVAGFTWSGLGSNTILGYNGDGVAGFGLEGKLQETRAYNRLLSEADINALIPEGDSPPIINITSPTSAGTFSTSSNTISLAGSVTDNISVTGVTVSCPQCSPPLVNSPATLDGSTWGKSAIILGPAPSTNVLTVTATDNVGLTAAQTLTVTYTVIPPTDGLTCTRWASQNGSGNGLTVDTPYTISQYWAQSGTARVLCLKDDTYSGINNMITPPTGIAGTSLSKITVRALNDGKVLIDGQNIRTPVLLNTTNQWFVIRGINAANGSTDVYNIIGDNNTLQRTIGWNGTSGQINAKVYNITGVNSLAEDCAAWGNNVRVLFHGSLNVSKPGVAFRRCWGEWNDHPEGGFTKGVGYLPGVDQHLENVIGTVNKTGN